MNGKVIQIVKSKVFCFFLIVIVLVVGFRSYVGQPIQVRGESMEDTLCANDLVWLDKGAYRKQDPNRNDIVVVRTADKKQQYIKRVIGLPGEKVKIKQGAVYINGEPLEEIAEFETMEDAGMAQNAIVLKENEYFLLGDNRNNSKDSRHVELGIVNRKQIKGCVKKRIFPLNKLGDIKVRIEE